MQLHKAIESDFSLWILLYNIDQNSPGTSAKQIQCEEKRRWFKSTRRVGVISLLIKGKHTYYFQLVSPSERATAIALTHTRSSSHAAISSFQQSTEEWHCLSSTGNPDHSIKSYSMPEYCGLINSDKNILEGLRYTGALEDTPNYFGGSEVKKRRTVWTTKGEAEIISASKNQHNSHPLWRCANNNSSF